MHRIIYCDPNFCPKIQNGPRLLMYAKLDQSGGFQVMKFQKNSSTVEKEDCSALCRISLIGMLSGNEISESEKLNFQKI